MAMIVERCHSARLTIPPQLSARRTHLEPVRLLDLSRAGARVEHLAPLAPGLLCVVDLPAALGRGNLTGRVVWSQVHRRERDREGAPRRYFQSGLTWTEFTPLQQERLTTALEILQAAQQE
jgi:hypothetical protein